MTLTPPFAAGVARLELEPWPLSPDQVVEGAPEVRGRVLHEDDTGERGVWEHEGARTVWRVHETLRKVFQVRRGRGGDESPPARESPPS